MTKIQGVFGLGEQEKIVFLSQLRYQYDYVFVLDHSQNYRTFIEEDDVLFCTLRPNFHPFDFNFFTKPDTVESFQWYEQFSLSIKDCFSLPSIAIPILLKTFRNHTPISLFDLYQAINTVYEERLDDTRGSLPMIEELTFQSLKVHLECWLDHQHPFHFLSNPDFFVKGESKKLFILETDFLTKPSRLFLNRMLPYRISTYFKDQKKKICFVFGDEDKRFKKNQLSSLESLLEMFEDERIDCYFFAPKKNLLNPSLCERLNVLKKTQVK